VLGAIDRASKHARAGDECMAAMHVALAGLPRLHDPSDAARRLFIADGLMNEGVAPRDIWTALDFDCAPLDQLEKFNPDQPRVPGGSGATSGQWTGNNSATSAEVSSAFLRQPNASEMIAESAARADGYATVEEGVAAVSRSGLLLALAPRLAGLFAFLGALLYSTPAGGERRRGFVPGSPELAWEEDEGLVTVTDEDGDVVLQARHGADGKFRVIYSAAYHRLLNEHSQPDTGPLPFGDPLSDQDDDEPKPCPEPPGPDKKGNNLGKPYANFMKGVVNQPPTPPGLGYQLANPWQNFDIVFYDDCERKTGTLIEYKGRYAENLSGKKKFGKFEESVRAEWLGEATRQVEASGGRPIRWYFAERPALEFARKIFSKYDYLKGIQLQYAPPPGGKF
jgi:hypothetical protein